MGVARVLALLTPPSTYTPPPSTIVLAAARAVTELTGGREGSKMERALRMRSAFVLDLDARCDECAGAAPAIVRALAAVPPAGDAVALCVALRNLAASDRGRLACVDAGAAPALVAALSAHTVAESGAAAAAVGEWCANVLTNLAYNCPPGRASCVAAGAVPAVVATLRGCGASRAVAEAGCSALANIAFDPMGGVACVAAGAPAALVAALEAHAGSAEVCHYAAGALLCIGWVELAHCAAIVEAGAVRPLAAAVVRHPTACDVARSALQKLGYADSGLPLALPGWGNPGATAPGRR